MVDATDDGAPVGDAWESALSRIADVVEAAVSEHLAAIGADLDRLVAAQHELGRRVDALAQEVGAAAVEPDAAARRIDALADELRGRVALVVQDVASTIEAQVGETLTRVERRLTDRLVAVVDAVDVAAATPAPAVAREPDRGGVPDDTDTTAPAATPATPAATTAPDTTVAATAAPGRPGQGASARDVAAADTTALSSTAAASVEPEAPPRRISVSPQVASTTVSAAQGPATSGDVAASGDVVASGHDAAAALRGVTAAQLADPTADISHVLGAVAALTGSAPPRPDRRTASPRPHDEPDNAPPEPVAAPTPTPALRAARGRRSVAPVTAPAPADWADIVREDGVGRPVAGTVVEPPRTGEPPVTD